ncbi:hypothetical protein KDA00_04260, partial [Candidatus Saccharibacteria bacterium]|nr:hypothetical protein [Candidatus Saccharibacteria bacterium]
DNNSKDDKSRKDNPVDGDKSEGKLKKLWNKIKSNKKLSIPVAALVLISIVLIIPFTRYTVLGLFVRKTVTVKVMDSKYQRPVSKADVTIAGKSAQTNGDGVAKVSGVPVGNKNLKVTKKYYSDYENKILVPVTSKAVADVSFESTGRQVPITIKNSINSKPLKDATITAGEVSAATDENGQAILVLSPLSNSESATISMENFNSRDVSVLVTESESFDNNFSLTPSGKIYFLSKKSGKIDVVKTNLDGTDRQTVLAGTGNEEDYSTTLLASRDWKYLVLHSRREDKAKLYLIETSNDQLTTIDEGDAVFTSVGWYGEQFIFSVDRNNVSYWQEKKYALKTYNANSKFLKTIDETSGEGSSDIDYASENFGQVYILDNELVYSKSWSSDYYSGGRIVGKKDTINSAKPDGGGKKVIKDFDASKDSYLDQKLYKPQEIYYRFNNYTESKFYEYSGGKFEEVPTLTDDQFYGYYYTFLLSPSGIRTFWDEPRDGKNTLFIGNKDADDAREIATLSEYKAYGWFTDEYILMSKNSSELYIGSQDEINNAIKITDYHKPENNFSGYGYGYGGL